MSEAPHTLDFLALGDIVTDNFIKLTNESIAERFSKEHKKLCFNFGDKVPYESTTDLRAVGNSPNAAVSATRLGLNSGLVTDVGDDTNGHECVATLKRNGVDDSFVTVHEGEETNYHFVLWYEAERTILVKHQEYDYKLPDIGSPKWLYLSSLAENSYPYHEKIADYLDEHPEIHLSFQPGTFQMILGKDKLKRLYERSQLFFCNREEAKRILEIPESEKHEMIVLLQKMHELGPDIAVITDGPEGSYAYDGKNAWWQPMYPDPKPPVDRTGAGDAFSSTFTAALGLGNDIPTALQWGPINSMSVVQYVGAQRGLLSREQLLEHLANAPEDYKPKKIA
ncbi:MAG: carbohydrate kinase family protein [Candidatus Paceibacterota bacterium]